MTDINYNTKKQTLEVSVRIFTEDFEKTLKNNCKCKVDLIKPVDKDGMNKLITNYITKHLDVKIDGKQKPLQFEGFAKEEESIWSYFVINNVAAIKKLEINNSLLYDFINQQTNMLHLQINNKSTTDKLDFPETNYAITY